MALQPGTRIGPYQVTSLLGQGGMGEVYRARDTKLGRDVALKVLPDVFADDPERLARFQREARVLASLNHPNIASIYGLEESGEEVGKDLEGRIRTCACESQSEGPERYTLAIFPCPSAQALASARTKSPPRSAKAAWAKCTGPTIRSSGAMWP